MILQAFLHLAHIQPSIHQSKRGLTSMYGLRFDEDGSYTILPLLASVLELARSHDKSILQQAYDK
jgi:hypothetical protein